MIQQSNDARIGGHILTGGLLALALIATGCRDSQSSFGPADDSVGNGIFGVTDGAPFVVTGPQGGPFPEGSRTYTLVNYTPGLFRWDLESSVPWLTSDALGGALGPMATSEVTLTLDHEYAATLPIGDYPADIVFTDRDHPDGELVMAFLLTVEAPPVGDLAVSPEEGWLLQASEAAGVEGETRTYIVTNEGEGTLAWAATSAEPWLLFGGEVSGLLEAGESAELPVSIHAEGLPAGADIHYGSVLFQNDGDSADHQEALVQVRLGEGSSSRVTAGLVAQYAFEEAAGGVVHDDAGALASNDLLIEDPSLVSWGPGSLTTLPGARLRTNGPASELSQALAASGELTLEAWIAPENTTQEGPARIVSLSGGSQSRDVTLGQGLWGGQPSDTYNVRLRSTETDLDGMPMLTTSAGAASVGLQHVVYTRATTGATRLFVNGVQRAAGSTPGDLSNWSHDFELLLGNEAGTDRSWSGRFHLVAIFDRALSAGEVTQNFEAGTGDASGPLLVATPGSGLAASGDVGGTVSPTEQTYTLSNGGSEPLSWEASIDGALAYLDGPSSGTLQPDETTDLIVRLDESLLSTLGAGTYESTLILTETTSGAGSTTRPITLSLEDNTSAGGGSGTDGGGNTGGGSNSTDYGEKPGAHNTGPHSPELLQPSGSITVTQDGAIIENVAVTGMIRINANNVTVRNFTVDGGFAVWYGVQVESGYSNAVIVDGEIHSVRSAAVIGAGFTAERLNTHHSEGDAFKTSGDNLVRNCWAHHLGMGEASHADANQTRSGDNIVLIGNNFDIPIPEGVNGPGPGFNSNATSMNRSNGGPISNLVMEGNWLNGGNFSIYLVQDTYPMTNVTIRNNRFGRDFRYGPLDTGGVIPGLVIDGNVWDDDDTLMSIND